MVGDEEWSGSNQSLRWTVLENWDGQWLGESVNHDRFGEAGGGIAGRSDDGLMVMRCG
jgi:hypothetical protein